MQIDDLEHEIKDLEHEYDSLLHEIRVSDIDRNIPQGEIKNDNTFVFIIENSSYEIPNGGCYNDAVTSDCDLFKKYCEKALSIDSQNISHYKKAKLEDLEACFATIKDISLKHNGEINIILYITTIGHSPDYGEMSQLLSFLGFGTEELGGFDCTEIWLHNTEEKWDEEREEKGVCYSLKRLCDELSAINTQKTICFIDVHRASIKSRLLSALIKTGSDNEDVERGHSVYIKPYETDDKEPPQKSRISNMVLFLASKDDEISCEKGDEHGLFEYFLMKKMQQSNGNVTLGDLFEYISVNVRHSAMDLYEKTQTTTVITYPDKNYNWKNLKLCN